MDILLDANGLGSFLVYFPTLLTLKYYLQTKITDYLFVSMSFLLLIISQINVFLILYEEDVTFRFTISMDFLISFFLALVAIRTKWEDPPRWAKFFVASLLFFAVLFQFIPPVFWGNWWIGQYFFNPILFVHNIFMIYCFGTTAVAIRKNSRAVLSKNLWVLHFILEAFKQSVVYYGVLNNWTILQYPQPLWVSIFFFHVTGLFILLLMHIFIPEAVLFSHEQIVRAKKVYDIVEQENILSKLGISTINNYLSMALKSVEVEQPEEITMV